MPLDRLRQSAVIAGAVGQVLAPLVAPRAVAEVTETLPRTPIRPIPATFAIWGPIFAGCGIYAGYQARPSVAGRELHQRVGWLMAAAFAGDTLWEIAVPRRHPDLGHVLVTTTATAATTAFLVLDRASRSGIGEDQTSADARPDVKESAPYSNRIDSWLVGAPVGSLAGWTTLATAISTADLLARHRVAKSDRARAATGAGSVAVAVALGARLCLRRRRALRRPHAAAYMATVGWGVGGIALRGLAARRG